MDLVLAFHNARGDGGELHAAVFILIIVLLAFMIVYFARRA